MKKLFKNNLGLIVLIGLILVVSYFNRWIFVYKFEPEYWENYYYTSQWNVPNSKRVISDSGVYRYIGYRLVNGENPFNVDYWVPPMGKYWYGVGAKYLENPYLVSFGFYLLSIWIIWLISKKWLVVYLWTINPLIVEQIGVTMLDLPMTLFFLTHIYFLFKGKYIISAIFLGLVAGTKPLYFVPMIGAIDWWYIWSSSKLVTSNKKLEKLFVFLFWVIGGYVMAYTCYFVVHPNPIPWIRLHEKVIDFQRGNGGSHDVLNIFKTIFLDKYKGFWVGGKEMVVTGWSTVLPVGTLLLLKTIFAKDAKIKYLSMLGIGYIAMCLTIDFWPRYLVMLISMLVLLIGYYFKNKTWVLILILVSYLPWLWFNFYPKNNTVIEKWSELIEKEQYRDAYRLLDRSSRQKIGEDKWLEFWGNNKEGYKINETVLENNMWKIKVK